MGLFDSSSTTRNTTYLTQDDDVLSAEDQGVSAEKNRGQITSQSTGEDALSSNIRHARDVNFLSTDQGTVEGAFQFAEGFGNTSAQLADQTLGTALEFARDIVSPSIELVGEISGRGISAANNAGQSAAQSIERAWSGAREDTTSKNIKTLAIGGAVLTGIVAVVMIVKG